MKTTIIITAASSLPLITHPVSSASASATIYSQLVPYTINPISSPSSQYPNLSFHPITSTLRYRRRRFNFRTQNSFLNFSSGSRDGDDNGDEDDDDDDFGRKRKRRRRRRWRRRRWWADYSPLEVDQEPGIIEEFIDSIWIFKVFGSYGWMLPAIIISILLATGPKAFLMALALPIGQSALTLAFKKLWGRTNPKRKTKTRKKPQVNTVSNIEFEEEEEEEEEEESLRTRKGTRGYRSWVARDDVLVNKESQNGSTFGGWDELDRPKEFDVGSLRSAQTGQSRRKRMKEGKSSRVERQSDMPLLLRLLIAVFPFLGSWTKML